MPEFQDFVSELDDIGVLINGRETFIATGAATPNWPDAIADLCLQGDKRGVRLYLPSGEHSALHAVLRGYPFSEMQRAVVRRNIVAGPVNAP